MARAASDRLGEMSSKSHLKYRSGKSENCIVRREGETFKMTTKKTENSF